MSKVNKAIATLEKLQEDAGDAEQLTTEASGEIEGGANISCHTSNTSCKPQQN